MSQWNLTNMARRILHLPKKKPAPMPEPGDERQDDAGYHAPLEPLLMPKRTPQRPRLPARAFPSEDDL
jgi:hypothetical protein